MGKLFFRIIQRVGWRLLIINLKKINIPLKTVIIFFIYKEIQMGSGAKSYTYEEGLPNI